MARAQSKKMTCMRLVNWGNDVVRNVNIRIRKNFRI